MRSLSYIIRNPLCIGSMLTRKFFKHRLPDDLYLRLLYFFEQGEFLNLSNPHKFTEKIQWLKLNNRNPELTNLVDKIEAKKIVASIIGDQYIIPTIGVWDKFDEIEFGKLPNSFVLKSTNGSGGAVYLCHSKENLDIKSAKEILESTSKGNVGITYREWPYLHIKPRIFAERLIEDNINSDLIDYKFFCFNEQPLYCQVIANRREKETIDFYDQNWTHQDFYGLNPTVPPSGKLIPKPKNFDEMLSIAKKLSKGFPFVRVDLYNVDGKIFFGEITFFPASGFGRFTPNIWNRKLGDKLVLPSCNVKK